MPPLCLGCLQLCRHVGKGQVSRYRAVSDDHTCAISLRHSENQHWQWPDLRQFPYPLEPVR